MIRNEVKSAADAFPNPGGFANASGTGDGNDGNDGSAERSKGSKGQANSVHLIVLGLVGVMTLLTFILGSPPRNQSRSRTRESELKLGTSN